MKNSAVQTKIYVLFCSVIFITVLTSYFSVNYVVSHYIRDSQTARHQPANCAGKDKLIGDIHQQSCWL